MAFSKGLLAMQTLLNNVYLLTIAGPEDDDEDSDVASKLDQSEDSKAMDTDQSESLTDSPGNDQKGEVVDPKTEERSIVKETGEITDENKNSPGKNDLKVSVGEMSPRELDVMKTPKFPSELLTLRQVDEMEFRETGVLWSVTSHVAISKDTTLGMYEGHTVSLSSIKPGELVLQVRFDSGVLTNQAGT